MLQYDTVNFHGVRPYLWNLGSTYTMYDPFTGNSILHFDNVPTGAIYESGQQLCDVPAVAFDEKGNLLVYVLDGEHNWLLMWNSTKAVFPNNRQDPPQGTYDWSRQRFTCFVENLEPELVTKGSFLLKRDLVLLFLFSPIRDKPNWLMMIVELLQRWS